MEKDPKVEQPSQVGQDPEVERDLEAEDDVLIENDSQVDIPFVLAEKLTKLGFKGHPAKFTAHPKFSYAKNWPRDCLYEGFELEEGTDTLIKVLRHVGQRYWQATFSPRTHQKRYNPGTMYMIYNTLYAQTDGLLCYLSVGKLPKDSEEKYATLLLLGHPDLGEDSEEQKASEEQKKVVAEMLGKEVSDIKEWEICER